MILGFLGGLVLGCLIGMLNLLGWHLVGTKRSLNAYVNFYWGTPIIVVGSAVFGALVGMWLGW